MFTGLRFSCLLFGHIIVSDYICNELQYYIDMIPNSPLWILFYGELKNYCEGCKRPFLRLLLSVVGLLVTFWCWQEITQVGEVSIRVGCPEYEIHGEMERLDLNYGYLENRSLNKWSIADSTLSELRHDACLECNVDPKVIKHISCDWVPALKQKYDPSILNGTELNTDSLYGRVRMHTSLCRSTTYLSFSAIKRAISGWFGPQDVVVSQKMDDSDSLLVCSNHWTNIARDSIEQDVWIVLAGDSGHRTAETAMAVHRLYTPYTFWSLILRREDVSCCNYSISFHFPNRTDSCMNANFTFNVGDNPVQFGTLYPEPDKVMWNGFEISKQKMASAGNKMRFHASFPEFVGVQEVRLSVLSLLMTAFAGFLGQSVKRIIMAIWNNRKRRRPVVS